MRLNREQLYRLLVDLNPAMEDRVVDELADKIDYYDKDGDGLLSLEEFVPMMFDWNLALL